MWLLIQAANLTQREQDIKLFVVNDTGKRILKKKVVPQSSDRFFQKSLKKFTWIVSGIFQDFGFSKSTWMFL